MSKTPKEIWCRSGLYYDYVDDWSEGSWTHTNDGGVKYVRADRIEELEAEIKSMAMDCLVAKGQASDAYQAQLLAEAKLAKAVEALQWLKVEIRGHGFSDEGRMLTMCISTLAELTGGKDE